MMSIRVRLPKTNLDVSPVCLGGNVFGWSANRDESFAVLDAFVAAGGNFIDTADVYSAWVEGHVGGESETIIGAWMAARGNRSDIILATKVAMLSTRPGLSRANILAAVEDSLRRLQTDYIDLYYAHQDDPSVELEETLGAFDELVKAGKVRNLGASNYDGARLREAAEVSKRLGYAEYSVLQNRYNLVDREEFESDAALALADLGYSCVPFYGIALGFLTGKYQPGVAVESARAEGAKRYFTEQNWATLAKVTKLANDLGVSNAAIALAWLRAQPTVGVPIASARTVEQVAALMRHVELNAEQLASLN
jgi:aryl-alcohol dehydrogenase-like predicted oxidoreductase